MTFRVYSFLTCSRLRVGLMPLCLGLMLNACVTTTTGGFNTVASDAQAIEDYINLAAGYFDAGNMAGARRNVNNALRLDSRNSAAYTVLAMVFQREGDLEIAAENFRRAINYDSGNSRARNNYAALLFSLQDYREAYAQLEQVVTDTAYEGRATAFENLGRSALMIDKKKEAAVAFQRALQLNSNLYLSSLELARILYDEGSLQAARMAFNQYLTTVAFYKLPHSPKALLAGIQIESEFQNQKMVKDFSLLLTTLYQDSPEYQAYQAMQNDSPN
jgi:type IV pilus assembly protein PilF